LRFLRRKVDAEIRRTTRPVSPYHRMHSFVCIARGFPVAAGQFQSARGSCAISCYRLPACGSSASRRYSSSSRTNAAFIRIHDVTRRRCVPLRGRDCYHNSRARSHACKLEPSCQLRSWLSLRVIPLWKSDAELGCDRGDEGSARWGSCCRLPIASVPVALSLSAHWASRKLPVALWCYVMNGSTNCTVPPNHGLRALIDGQRDKVSTRRLP